MDLLLAHRWLAFGALVLILISADLFVHRGGRGETTRSALAWSAVWVCAGLGFGGYIWATSGPSMAQDYLAAWLIEKSLSVDNLFVFLVIFDVLRIPKEKQRTVLYWGMFGALVFRAIFVWLGTAALEYAEWFTYLFGGLLLGTAWRVLHHDPSQDHGSPTITLLRRCLPVTSKLEGTRFVVREHGRLMATPLLLAVLAVELTDILFAIDSVPAAFSVSRDPTVVYMSNALAVLGLRALFIVLARALRRLRYLHYGLAGVLAFAGAKLIFEPWVHVAPWASIVTIAAIMTGAVVASVVSRRAIDDRPPDLPGTPIS